MLVHLFTCLFGCFWVSFSNVVFICISVLFASSIALCLVCLNVSCSPLVWMFMICLWLLTGISPLPPLTTPTPNSGLPFTPRTSSEIIIWDAKKFSPVSSFQFSSFLFVFYSPLFYAWYVRWDGCINPPVMF